jgi:hypothetical protein
MQQTVRQEATVVSIFPNMLTHVEIEAFSMGQCQIAFLQRSRHSLQRRFALLAYFMRNDCKPAL